MRSPTGDAPSSWQYCHTGIMGRSPASLGASVKSSLHSGLFATNTYLCTALKSTQSAQWKGIFSPACVRAQCMYAQSVRRGSNGCTGGRAALASTKYSGTSTSTGGE